ncbi:hypothetical protein NUACC26_052450 [Scytonema sp. NUACC26]
MYQTQQNLYPKNFTLSILGDFHSQRVRSLIQAKLGDWKSNPKMTKPQLPLVSQAKKGGVFFINQPQLTQK